MGTEQWAVLGTGIPLAGILSGLGFAAMSTNPPFRTPPKWLPKAFFISSGLVALATIIYLILPIISKIQVSKTTSTWFVVGIIMLMLLLLGDIIRDNIRDGITNLVNYIHGQPSKRKNKHWLSQVLKDDLETIKLVWQEPFIYFEGFGKTDPYFDLILKVANANVYAITITVIEGFLLIEGQKGIYPSELISGRFKIVHGEIGEISIRQGISSEMKRFIINQARQSRPLTIGLSACKIIMKREVEGYEKLMPITFPQQTIQFNIKEKLEPYILNFQN